MAQLKIRDGVITFSLLVLFLGACRTTPSTALPETPSLPVSPTIVASSPTPTQLSVTKQPEAFRLDQVYIDKLQKKGITVTDGNNAGSENWELAYQGTKVPEAIIDQNGLTININTGPITIPLKRVVKSINVVDGAIVVDYPLGTHLAVFDPTFTTEKWRGRCVSKYEALKKKYDGVPEAWVQVSTYAELDEAVKLGKLLSREFPFATYLPPLYELYVDYDEEPYTTDGDYNARFPFGTRKDFRNNLPFMFVNHILLLPNEAEDRKYYSCILQEAVYNADGTKGILNISTSEDTQDECIGIAGGMRVGIDHYENGDYILPIYNSGRGSLDDAGFLRLVAYSYKAHGLASPNGVINAKMKQYVITWFSTGVLPKELEEIIIWGPTRTFEKWD